MPRVNRSSRNVVNAKRRRFIQQGSAMGAALALPVLPLLAAEATPDAAAPARILSR